MPLTDHGIARGLASVGLGLALLVGCGAQGGAPPSACDGVTEATTSSPTRCTEPGREPRCQPYVGGPTYDSSRVMDGCNSAWRCPEAVVGFICAGGGGAFDCRCVRDGVDTADFTWTGDPCTREGTARFVAAEVCAWDVP